MAYPYFSRDGKLLPTAQATIPLSRVEYSYGFGVYENIRVSKGNPYFLDDHCQRLLRSAEIISLEHSFNPENIKKYVSGLIAKNKVEACNIKVLLIGGRNKEAASLEILCLNPLFPDRKLYSEGTKVITYEYEREFPQAKTLNMLSSYLAYRQARSAGAYDALLIDHAGNIREGTRTNFFCLKDRTLITPPADQVLAGVTRAKVIEVAGLNNFEVKETDITLREIGEFDSLCLTSTSSKIMPVSAVGDIQISISSALRELMQAFDHMLLQA